MARPFSTARGKGLGFAPWLALLGATSCSPSGQREQPSMLEDLPRVAYAVRQHTLLSNNEVQSIDVAGGMGQVTDYGRYVPGARLELLDPKSGAVRNLIAAFPAADVASLDVDFSATEVVFSMKRDESDHYHLYVSPLEPAADGSFSVTQLTAGPYDDQDAIFAGGHRIVFTTNQPYTEMGARSDEYGHARRVTELASITIDGGDADRTLCPQNLSNVLSLFALADGRVGFSRWEHFGDVDDVKLFAMNPDCSGVVALAGQHGKPSNSLVQVNESATAGVLYGVATERENTLQAGALVRLDARSSTSTYDEEKAASDAYRVLTPGVPLDDAPSAEGRYRSPVLLARGTLLVSWADGPVNDVSEVIDTPPNFGVYVFDPDSNRRELVVDYEDSWELYAKPVVARPPPPAYGAGVRADATTPALLGSVDIARTSLTSKHAETVSGAEFTSTSLEEALARAVRVRVIEGFSYEAIHAPSFGLTTSEGAALLGEATVQSDGSWLAQVPPYVPLRVQPIDEFDLAIRTETTWQQALPGEHRVCGGCHEDRSMPAAAAEVDRTLAATVPEPFTEPIAERVEFPWTGAAGGVQEILGTRCATCHNQSQNGDRDQEYYSVALIDAGTMTSFDVPRLDLSDRPITLMYDGVSASWPASYVSLFYPAIVALESGAGANVVGAPPPLWAVPSDARHSLLIEKLNVTSERDPGLYAWPLGEPFSDPTVHGGQRSDHAALAGLTRDELVTLIRAIDLGGQFYSRQNAAFAPADWGLPPRGGE